VLSLNVPETPRVSGQGRFFFALLSASYCLTIVCAACWAIFLVEQKTSVGLKFECFWIISIKLYGDISIELDIPVVQVVIKLEVILVSVLGIAIAISLQLDWPKFFSKGQRCRRHCTEVSLSFQGCTPFRPTLANPLTDVVDIGNGGAHSYKPHVRAEFHSSNDNLENSATVLIKQMDFINLAVR
jgi:hypothetical protein